MAPTPLAIDLLWPRTSGFAAVLIQRLLGGSLIEDILQLFARDVPVLDTVHGHPCTRYRLALPDGLGFEIPLAMGTIHVFNDAGDLRITGPDWLIAAFADLATPHLARPTAPAGEPGLGRRHLWVRPQRGARVAHAVKGLGMVAVEVA